MNFFLTGATGFIGRNLCDKLSMEGHEIIALTRSSSANSFFSKRKITQIKGDITRIESYRNALRDVDCVINLAGAVTDWAPYKLYFNTHVHGLKNLLDASSQSRSVKKFIHISTVDVLKKNNRSRPLFENTPLANSGIPYIHTKVLGEKLALGYNDKFDVVIIRPVWVYGVGDRTLFPEIAYQLKKKSMVLIKSRNIFIPLVHVKNLCEAIISAAKKDGIGGQAFLISDGEKTWGEIVEQVTKGIEGQKRIPTLPYSLAYLIACLMEFTGKVFRFQKRPLLTRTAVEMLGKSIQVDTAKAKKVLAYHPTISIQRGLEEVIEWLQNTDLKEIRQK